MKKIPFLSLQLRLLLPVLIVIIPGTILSINTLIGERQHLKTDILDLTFRTAQIISVQEEGLIEATRELLITISHEPFLQKGKLHDNQQFLSSLLNQLGRYTNIEIADTTCNIISSAIPFALHTTIADRVYFRNIMKNGNFAIREYQVDRIIGQPAINFAYPIVNEIGEKTGIVLAVLDLKKLKNLEEKIVFKLPEGCIL